MPEGIVHVDKIKLSPRFALEELRIDPRAVAGCKAGTEKIPIKIFASEIIGLCRQLKPEVSSRKATRVILEDDAKFILQLSSTAVARALMDVAEKNKIIFTTLSTQ